MENKKYKKITAEAWIEGFHQRKSTQCTRIIQAILDEESISHRGYSTIFKSMQSKMKDSRLNYSLLPNPTSIKRICQQVNEEVLQELGSPFHIEDTYNTPTGDVVFNRYNNNFYSLEALQTYVVQLFEITRTRV